MTMQTKLRRALPGITIGAVLVVIATTVALLAAQFLHKEVKPQKKIVQVQLFRPPPPPPKIEQPPPPEQEKVKLPEPKQDVETPDVPNAPGPLGLDADGVAGSDAFGLVGRRGGEDIIGGDGRFRWYANRVKDQVLDRLSADHDVRNASYSVVVRIWIGVDGKLGRCDLVGSSGNADLDGKLRLALADIGKFAEAPPEGMPQPVRLRIQSRA
jgi:periplasmic protein TonB